MTTGSRRVPALLVVALVPLWSMLGGTVTDVQPGCAAIVQAQDPQTGQGDPDGYTVLDATTDSYGDQLDVGRQVMLNVGSGLDASEPRPVTVVADELDLSTQGVGWLDAESASVALKARCSPPEM
jgi:hypothetical protein